MWNLSEDYSLIKTLEGHKGAIQSMLQVSTSHYYMLIAGSEDRTVRVWDII